MNPVESDVPAPPAQDSPIPASDDTESPRRWVRKYRQFSCLGILSLVVAILVLALLTEPKRRSGLAFWTLPELSPDLQHIAVVYTSDDGPRVLVGETPCRSLRPVETALPGVDTVKWVLGGRRLLAVSDYEGIEKPQLWLLSADTGRLKRISPDANAAYRSPVVSPSGRLVAYASNERRQDSFDIYLLDCATLQRKMLVRSTDFCFASSFSPDERQLCVVHEHDSRNFDIDVVDIGTGKVTRVTPHNGDAAYSGCVWTPDARCIYLITNQDREFKSIGLVDLREKTPHVVVGERQDYDITSIDVSRDGRYRSTTVLKNGDYETTVEDTTTGRVLPLPYRRAVFSASFTPDSTHVLLDAGAAYSGPMRYLVDLRTLESERVGIKRTVHTDSVVPRWITYRSGDGAEVHGLLWTPPGAIADGKHPFIVMFHGGPTSMTMPYFNQGVQSYLKHGYIVMAPNIRGSSGRGRTWEEADDGVKRRVALEDGAEAARWAIKSGWADPHKVVAMGSSYGGYMTLCMLAYYPDLYAAGVDRMGMSDLVTFLNNIRPWSRASHFSEYGNPVKDAAFLRSISPVFAPDGIRRPVLVVQGANDPRVPREQSDEIVNAIRRRGGIVEYKVLQGEGHGWTDPGDYVTDVNSTIAFLEEYAGVNR